MFEDCYYLRCRLQNVSQRRHAFSRHTDALRTLQGLIAIPKGLSAEVLERLASIHKKDKVLFMDAVRVESGMTLREAKCLALRIRHDAKCHWCGAPLPATSVAACDSLCKAINIDLSLLYDCPFK